MVTEQPSARRVRWIRPARCVRRRRWIRRCSDSGASTCAAAVLMICAVWTCTRSNDASSGDPATAASTLARRQAGRAPSASAASSSTLTTPMKGIRGGRRVGICDRAPMCARRHPPRAPVAPRETDAEPARDRGAQRLQRAVDRWRCVWPLAVARSTERAEIDAIDRVEDPAADACGEEILGGEVCEGNGGRGVRREVDVELPEGVQPLLSSEGRRAAAPGAKERRRGGSPEAIGRRLRRPDRAVGQTRATWCEPFSIRLRPPGRWGVVVAAGGRRGPGRLRARRAGDEVADPALPARRALGGAEPLLGPLQARPGVAPPRPG
jgi:hypothetical protein